MLCLAESNGNVHMIAGGTMPIHVFDASMTTQRFEMSPDLSSIVMFGEANQRICVDVRVCPQFWRYRGELAMLTYQVLCARECWRALCRSYASTSTGFGNQYAY
jgi:hypothetical protein